MKIVLLLTIVIFAHCCYLLFAHTFKSVCHVDFIIKYSDKESQHKFTLVTLIILQQTQINKLKSKRYTERRKYFLVVL